MHYLSFDLSEGVDGVLTLEALASTASGQHAAALAEAQALLDWAWREFPSTHGPAEEGMDWDHDLQVAVEEGGWQAVTLTLTGSERFMETLFTVFGNLAG